MSTDEEADQSSDNHSNYEGPALTIGNRSEGPSKSNAKELQNDSERQRSPFFHRFKDWLKEHATPMNFLTLVIAVAAWAQFHATNGQLQTMNRQLDEMRSSGKDTSKQAMWIINNMNWLAKEMHFSVQQSQVAMQRTERQSQAALDASKDVLRTDQRAWLSVGGIPNEPMVFQANKPFEPNITLVNTGRTPALNAFVRFRATSSPKGTTLNFAKKISQTSGTTQIFGPGFSAPLRLRPEDDLVTPTVYGGVVTDKTLNLFVYGRVDYLDAFGFKHWIEFSYVYDPATNTLWPQKTDIDKELR